MSNEMKTKKTLKVYILAGQSNMVGHAKISTLPSAGKDLETLPLLQKVVTDDETLTPKIFDKIWITTWNDNNHKEHHGNLSLGFGGTPQKIGPELMFGVKMEELQDKEDQHNPILLIKTAWGGTTLHTDFRPPSAGKKEGNEEESGIFYHKMISQVQRVLSNIPRVVPKYDTEKDDYEIAGFVWFQGFNDLIAGKVYPNRVQPGGYDEYGRLLSLFIQDVRKDLAVPGLPFVIGVSGHQGADTEKPHVLNFRQGQEIPVTRDKLENVAAVRTERFWDHKLAALQDKMQRIENRLNNHKRKHPSMTQNEKRKQRKEWQLETCTKEELELYETSRSDGGYHYFGSAKFFLQAGNVFADALFDLEQGKNKKRKLA